MIGVLLLAVSLDLVLAQSTERGDWYRMGDLKIEPAACETFLAQTEQKLGVRIPRFTYVRVATAGDVVQQSRVPLFAVGFADTETYTVYSVQPCSTHEMAHLVIARAAGRIDGIFEEGAATMLGGLTQSRDFVDRLSARQYARRQHATYDSTNEKFQHETVAHEVWYLLAESWVRHLVKERGLPLFAEFLRACGKTHDARRAFRIIYGADLDKAFAYWLYGDPRGPSHV